jgi:hypothetical protein
MVVIWSMAPFDKSLREQSLWQKDAGACAVHAITQF